MINPADESTWPSGDKIWDVARAIAKQEGYGPPRNLPTRACNPGDLSDGNDRYGFIQTDSRVTTFPDDETGWQWLYNKLRNALEGKSSVYFGHMTFLEIGQRWATDPHWWEGVAKLLGVDPQTTLATYVNWT